MGFFVPLVGWGAAALGGATALTGTAGRAFKEQLGWDEMSAAQEELMQGKYKGYDPTKGKINRSWVEGIRDDLLGNDPQKIQEITQQLQTDNVTKDKGAEVAEVNRLIREAGGTEQIKIDHTSTNQSIQQQIDRLGPKARAVLQGQADAPDAGITMDTPTPQIAVMSREGQRQEGYKSYYGSPQYQQYLDQLKKSDQNFQATMALQTGQMALSNKRADNQMEIAMLNNQLESRRMDSADRRADRRDRQAYIQQMMQGLSTLGASLAI